MGLVLRIRTFVTAATLLISSGAANAGLIGYCHAIVGSDYYFTHVTELPENSAYVSIHQLFETFVENRVGKTPRTARCDGFETREEAEQMRSEFLRNLASRGTSTTFLSNFPPDPRQAGLTKRPAGSQEASKTTEPPIAPGAQEGEKQAARGAEREAVAARNREKQAKYEAELAEQQRKVAEYEQARRDVEAKKAEQRAAADRVLAEHQRRMNAHAQEVRLADAASLEYKKELAKPANAPSAVYRGFTGNDCAMARLSAVKGAGTDSGTQFKEVESEMVSGHCVVRGWWWSTSKSGSSRQ